MDPFLAGIIMFGGNFAPRGWALCDGQLLPINQYQALFSLLGTTYGGDGRTTFALPDLRGRVAMHPGSGPGLTTRRLGEKSGVEFVTLNTTQIPSHNHTAALKGVDEDGLETSPDGHVLGISSSTIYATNTPANATLRADSIAVGNTGGNREHTNVQPFTCVNYIIALQGTFPSRS